MQNGSQLPGRGFDTPPAGFLSCPWRRWPAGRPAFLQQERVSGWGSITKEKSLYDWSKTNLFPFGMCGLYILGLKKNKRRLLKVKTGWVIIVQLVDSGFDVQACIHGIKNGLSWLRNKRLAGPSFIDRCAIVMSFLKFNTLNNRVFSNKVTCARRGW